MSSILTLQVGLFPNYCPTGRKKGLTVSMNVQKWNYDKYLVCMRARPREDQ